MSEYLFDRITCHEACDECAECLALCRGACVGRPAAAVEAADVADANRMSVVGHSVFVFGRAVRPVDGEGASLLDGAVEVYDIIIAYHAPSLLAVHVVDVLGSDVSPGACGRAVDDDGVDLVHGVCVR